jgi:uncharacterized protein YndB with AHSA1/START domain
MSDATPVPTAEREITITRVFDAPRELVFKAWTEPEHVSQWLGPDGFDTPRESIEIDLRVGGPFNLRMVKRDSGMEYWIRYEIVEFVEPELLVLKCRPMPEMGLDHATLARVELHDEGGKTRMTLTDGPYTENGGRGAGRGWEQSFDKLSTLLAAG